MKKDNWRLLFNPFTRIAGWKGAAVGLVIVLVAVVIGYFSHTVFYGLSTKLVPSISWGMAFGLQGIGLASTLSVLYLTGVLASKTTRFQDMLATVTISRFPMLFVALGDFLVSPSSFSTITQNALNGTLVMSDIMPVLLLGIIMMVFLVWSIAIMYQGFKVSTGMKGPKAGGLFALGMVVSEILTLVLVGIIF